MVLGERNNPELSNREVLRLRTTLRKMSIPMLYKFANEYNVEIPDKARDKYTILNSFIDELTYKSKREILSKYGDSGRASSFIYKSREKTPDIKDVFQRAKKLLEYKPESKNWERFPYFDEVEVDYLTNSLRIRFHYLLGSVILFDEETGRSIEHRKLFNGIVIYRPRSTVLEIRVKHRSMARIMRARIPVYLGLEPFISINLMEKELNRKFIKWINSLNSATIELPLSEVSGSLIISARKCLDLRTAKRYKDELEHGRLRNGHVTINHNERDINFHIYFKECHKKYTLFSSEEDIEYVVNAIEKISEGYEFAKPEKLLADFFKE